MANNPAQPQHPAYPGFYAEPFTVSQAANAAAANTITLAAVAGKRYFICRIVATMLQVTVVNGEATMTNIRDNAGAATTVRWKIVDTAAGGALVNIDASGWPYVAVAENTAVVISIPAITSGGASALEVSGFLA